VHDVDAHVSRAGDALDRIHVGAVEVDEAAALMNDLAHLGDVLLEETERARIRDHQPVGIALELDRSAASERARCWVGPMRTVRDEYLVPVSLTACVLPCAHDHEPAQLALCSSRGLQ